MSSREEIAVPEMVSFEVLTKIIIGYLKVGADKEAQRPAEVAKVADVSASNVSLNSKFLRSIGVIEGSRGRYKLTPAGSQYAQALDWGRLNEANKLLQDLLKDKPITQKTTGYVDINKPVEKEALIGQIASIAEVHREPRFETGIRGFVDMLVTSALLEEDEAGRLVSGKPLEGRVPSTEPEEEAEGITYPIPTEPLPEPEPQIVFPITLSFTISDETNVQNLKKILRAIKEVFMEE